jgi:ribosomal protein RSM22 (predicted rRNA methylase)
LKNIDSNKRAFGPFSLSIEQLKPHLLISNMTEPEIVKAIKDMSAKFTTKRDHITDYVLDHRQVSAYASFYLPTNIPKLHFLLDKLPEAILEDFQNRPFIDMGAGPGTFSLGYKMLMDVGAHVEIIAVDTAQIMLDQATKLMNGFFPSSKFQAVRKFSEKKSNSILFFGHSINEMGIDKAQDQIMTIDPEYVMWIEPGTSEFFHDIKKLRHQLLESYDVIYPCPGNAGCPSDWCHQVLRTSHDSSVERLSQMVSLDRKILPMVGHVYKRKQKVVVENGPITIRFMNETKFSFEYEVCMQNENLENRNVVIEIQKKQLSKIEEKAFKSANVGERINFEIEKLVQDKLRVKLKREE